MVFAGSEPGFMLNLLKYVKFIEKQNDRKMTQ